MPKRLIRQYACQHCFANWHSTNTNAGIVAAFGEDFGFFADYVHGLAWVEDGGGWLHGETRHDLLAGGDAAHHAAAVVGEEFRAVFAFAHFVGVFLAGKGCGGHAVADFDAFDGVDAHQGASDLRIELGVDRSAETGGDAIGYDFDNRAAGRAFLAQFFEIIRPRSNGGGVGAEERVLRDFLPIPLRAGDLLRADLDQRAAHGHLLVEKIENLARNRTRRNAACGFARALPPAAAIVAHAIFGEIGEIGVAGPKFVADIGVVLGAGIHVFDQQRDGGAGRYLLLHPLVLEDAGEDAHL